MNCHSVMEKFYRKKQVHLFKFNVAFAVQMIVFYMKCNTGLKWFKNRKSTKTLYFKPVFESRLHHRD